MKSDFLKLFHERGYFHQCTDEAGLDEAMLEPQVVYIGFDCTAPALHVGSLVQIMILRHLQALGHKPLVVLGGGTTKVGDPSGKDETRRMLTDEVIISNMHKIQQILEQFLQFGDSESDALIVNNAEWFSDLNYIEFLRDVGQYFSINRMLGFESVKRRLDREQNLSFLEFNYMVLQAYDFVELHRRYRCNVQIGGSDQWGNIVSGKELGRRMGTEELFGLTTPLLTTASGAKMGKTASGAVWLTESLLSPYDYWQFWRNTDDQDVGRFLRLFTELSLEEIETLEALQGVELNEAKKILANEATTLCHGKEKTAAAEATARKTFEEGSLSDNLPTLEMEKSEFADGMPAYMLLKLAGLAESNGAARRLIRGGGARVNDTKLTSEDSTVTLSDFKDGVVKLSSGKKKHVLVSVK